MPEATESTKTPVTLAGRGTTEKIPTKRTGTSPVPLVSYLTVVLTCVFTALFLVYIATCFPSFNHSSKEVIQLASHLTRKMVPSMHLFQPMFNCLNLYVFKIPQIFGQIFALCNTLMLSNIDV